MALNPVAYTEHVARSFLRYQLTAYPFADPRLHAQMRELLSLDATRRSPLLKGPYVSLSRPFRQGAAVDALIGEGLLHPHLRERIPDAITHLYGHQERALRAIAAGRTTLVATGTGSGKTECFLYPIVSRCLALRDEAAPPGVSAVIVYPMNALAEDQLMRLRGLLAGTGIPFGMYVGKTPEHEADVVGIRLPPGSSRADYEARLARAGREGSGETVQPAEEVCSREVMRTAGRQPRILLTNVKQLELLLTRQQDVELFAGARLDFLVFDEAHTFTGALGAETACLVRRLRTFCRTDPAGTTCVATSATIVDHDDPQAGRNFAARFFGVAADSVAAVEEDYETDVWAGPRSAPRAPAGDPAALLDRAVAAVGADAAMEAAAGENAATEAAVGEGTETEAEARADAAAEAEVRGLYRALAGEELGAGDWPAALHAALSRNEVVFRLNEELATPKALEALPPAVASGVGRPVTEAEILAWLTLGAAARRDGRPLLRPVVHGFVRGIGGAVVSFPADRDGPKLWLAAEDAPADAPGGEERLAQFKVATCTVCGQHYYLAFLQDFTFTRRRPEGGAAGAEGSCWERQEEQLGGRRVVLVDTLIGEDEEAGEATPHARTAPLHFCRGCGAAHPAEVARCRACGRRGEDGSAARRAAERAAPRPAHELPLVRLDGQHAGRRPLPGAGPTGPGHQRGGRARAGPGHGAPRAAAAAAGVLRQPAGRRVPGRLDEGPRPPLPAAGADGGGHPGEPAIHRRPRRSSRRPAGARRGALPRARSGSLGGGAPRARGGSPRAGTPQVPALPGAARGHPGVAAGAGPGALGPDEGGVRRPRRLPALAPATRPPARRLGGAPAGGRGGRARLPAPAAGAPRPRARDLHAVLEGRRPRGAAGLPAESPRARGDEAAPGERREAVAGGPVAQRGRPDHDAADRPEVGGARGRRRAVPREPLRVPGGTRPAGPGPPQGLQGTPAARGERRAPGERRPAPPGPQPGRVAVPELPAHDHPRDAARPLPGFALRRHHRVGAGRRGQLRPAAPRRRVLDAALRGAHGDGPGGRARAAGEPVPGRLGGRQLPGLHADAGARHRHRPARLRAHAQRAAAARQLPAARGPRRPPASHGGAPDLLPPRVPRPRLLRRAPEAARRPHRSPRLQPAQRRDGRQARARDRHRRPARLRTRPRPAGCRAGGDPGGAAPLPAPTGGAVPVRGRRGPPLAVRLRRPRPPGAAPRRGPGGARGTGVPAGLAGRGGERRDAGGARRPRRPVHRGPGAGGRPPGAAAALGHRADRPSERAARTPRDARTGRRGAVPALRPAREAPQGGGPAVPPAGGGPRRRQHVQRPRRGGLPARLRARGRVRGGLGGDPLLAHRGQGLQPAAPARDGAPRVRARQPHLRQRAPLRGPALPPRPRRRPGRRRAVLRRGPGLRRRPGRHAVLRGLGAAGGGAGDPAGRGVVAGRNAAPDDGRLRRGPRPHVAHLRRGGPALPVGRRHLRDGARPARRRARVPLGAAARAPSPGRPAAPGQRRRGERGGEPCGRVARRRASLPCRGAAREETARTGTARTEAARTGAAPAAAVRTVAARTEAPHGRGGAASSAIPSARSADRACRLSPPSGSASSSARRTRTGAGAHPTASASTPT